MKKKILCFLLAAAVVSVSAPALRASSWMEEEGKASEYPGESKNQDIQEEGEAPEYPGESENQDMQEEGKAPEYPGESEHRDIQEEGEDPEYPKKSENPEPGQEDETLEDPQEWDSPKASGSTGDPQEDYGEAPWETGNAGKEWPELPPEEEEREGSPDQQDLPLEEQETEGENGSAEDFPFTIFDEKTAGRLEGGSEEDQRLAEEIQSGQILAIAPIFAGEMESLPQGTMLTISSGKTRAALQAGEYVVHNGGSIFCDEVWTQEAVDTGRCMATSYRYVSYLDSGGNERTSPLYCMNARKSGFTTGDTDFSLKEEACRFMDNSNLKKILYFGYGGPGNICGGYDPTCSHIDWSRWQNQYFFTHMALSIEYASDYNHASAEQVSHIGLSAFLSRIKSLTIPSRTGVKLRGRDTSGDQVTTGSMRMPMILYPSKPKNGFDWLDPQFDGGFQRTGLLTVVDEGSAGNGITITRSAEAAYQVYYWKSREEYETRGMADPRILAKGDTLTLKNGYRFGMVFPKNLSKSIKYTYTMTLYPVQYLFVDGNIQSGSSGSDIQDFGAFVYSGAPGTLTLTLLPADSGELRLTKTSIQTKKAVPGAKYRLLAAQDLQSGNLVQFQKGETVWEKTTDQNGRISFTDLIPGKYEIKETGTAKGFLLDTRVYSASVSAGKTAELSVTEIPDIKGQVSIEKVAQGTSLHLEDAVFMVYAWSEKTKSYSADAARLTYDGASLRYVSRTLVYSADNLGKFCVRETRNPPGYTGSWMKLFALEEPGTEKTFSFVAENSPSEEKRLELRKVDAENQIFLEGAEFTLYEYDDALGDYADTGTLLECRPEEELYVSGELAVTDHNQGSFLVKETKNPPGYTGSWQQEISVSDGNGQLQFTVENEPAEQPKGRAEIVKKDSLTGELLEGASFVALQWNEASQAYEDTLGENREVSYLEEERKYRTAELPITEENLGKFRLLETENPPGYTGSWEEEVQLSKENPLVSCEAANDPERLPVGSIRVIKKIPEDGIVWAHGNPVFSFVAEGTDQRGNYRKYENFVRFSQGGCEKDGQGYAVCDVTFQNVPLGTYEVYEKPVLRYYLKAVQAGTPNVTVTEVSPPAFGKLPRETAWASAALTVGEKEASVTFVNENGRFDGYSHTDVVKNSIPYEK